MRKPQKQERQMTELEATILAIIGQAGPMTAYDIRKVFADSLTPAWSSSPGAVYPAVRRLKQAGLVDESKPSGSRGRKRINTTAKGRKVLTEWLGTLPPQSAGPTPDPIRTRMYFLGSLTAEQRTLLLSGAIRDTEAALVAARESLHERSRSGRDKLQIWVAEGVLFQLDARLQWLRQLAERVQPEEE